MANQTDAALQAQMRADPRLKAAFGGRTAGRVLGSDLQKLGYDVPAGYSYVVGGRSGYGTLMDDKRSLMEKAAPIIAITAAVIASAGAAGAIPGIAGVSAAPAAASEVATAGGGLWGGIKKVLGVGGDGVSTGSKIIDWAQILGPLAGNLIGGKLNADSSKEAAEIQAKSFADALALQREMYGLDRADEQTALALEAGRYAETRADSAPYRAAGGGAVTRMSDLLMNSAPPQLPGNVSAVMNAPARTVPDFKGPTMPTSSPSPSNAWLQPGPKPVTLMGPDGSRRQFQAGDPSIARHLQDGARQVA